MCMPESLNVTLYPLTSISCPSLSIIVSYLPFLCLTAVPQGNTTVSQGFSLLQLIDFQLTFLFLDLFSELL